MKESKFIDQKLQQWADFEEENRKKVKNPKLLSKYFIQITDDLSYARTFYRNRLVRVYLNSAAQCLFYGIYKNERNTFSKFIRFWKEDLPIATYRARKAFLLSFFIFSLAFIIGILSSANDGDFSKTILGEEYIKQTLVNIEKGDPMAIYKKEAAFDMFFSITFNNLLVAFRTFIFGVFLSLGSVMALLYNGIMVGVFQYFFIERGLFWESFLTIWQHGTLEISSIIIAGSAGLVMGKGLVFPQTLSRFVSFKLSAKRGLKIMAGIVPILIFAAFIESFFTRYTNAPDWIRILVIVFSLAFILFYFVWFPYIQYKNPKISKSEEETLSATEYEPINRFISYSNQELTSNTFKFIKGRFSKISKLVFSLSFLSVSTICLYIYFNKNADFEIQTAFFKGASDFFDYKELAILFFINILLYTIIGLWNLQYISGYFNIDNKISKLTIAKLFTTHLLVAVLINIGFFINPVLGILIMITIIPVLEFSLFTSYIENIPFYLSFSKAFELLKHSWTKLLGLYIKLLLFGFALLYLISLDLIWQLFELIMWNIYLREDFYYILNFFVRLFVTLSFILFIFNIIKDGIYLFYFSAKEASTAFNLKERINHIGKRKRIYGYEIENNHFKL